MKTNIDRLKSVGNTILNLITSIQETDMFMKDDKLLSDMCESIKVNKTIGLYDGAYKVVELAMGLKNK